MGPKDAMAAVTRLLHIGLTLVSLATAATLARYGGWLVAREFTADYRDSPHALIGVSLLVAAVAISAGLAWTATERQPRRCLLTAFAAFAPVLLAATALPH